MKIVIVRQRRFKRMQKLKYAVNFRRLYGFWILSEKAPPKPPFWRINSHKAALFYQINQYILI